MEPRKFHIQDFPESKIRILLKDKNEFFNKAIASFGTEKSIAEFLKISPLLLSQWKKDSSYLPLSFIKKMVERLKLNWEDIEKKVIAYKGVSTGSPIRKPKIPIRETPEVFELITHIICDGCVNKNGIPCYVNTNKALIANFESLLKEIFGDVDIKLYQREMANKACYELRFPKMITQLSEDFYNLNFYENKKIPFEILELPKEFGISVVRAFADDEGSVDLNRRICFSSINKNLLEMLIKILKEKLDYKNISDIGIKDDSYFYFYIKTGDIEKYQKEINFLHPDKIKRLNEMIHIRKEGYKPGQHGGVEKTTKNILDLLNNKILSTYDIIKVLKINKSNVNIPVKRLINHGLIVQHHKEGQIVFWTRNK